MEKIIAAFDGLKYSQGAEGYAIRLAGDADAHLVGIFLDDFTHHSYVLEQDNYVQMLKNRLEGDESDRQARLAAAGTFEQACRHAGINHSIHHDHSLAVQELLHESIYADLMVVDKTQSFSRHKEDTPVGFIRYMLANAECPILVVPSKYTEIQKIILLYDGSPSSVYAIKMFSYLLPGFQHLPAEVISVIGEGQSRHLPENHLMKEFMKRHFPHAVYHILQGNPETQIVQYLKNRKQDELLVLGAYHRNMVSRWFKPSMADRLMLQLKTPLFVAHR